MGALKAKLSLAAKRLIARVMYAAGFNNAAGIRKNFWHELYHFACRWNYRRLGGTGQASSFEDKAFETYSKNAVMVIPPEPAMEEAMKGLPGELLTRLHSDSSKRQGNFDFMHQFFLTAEEFEQVKVLLTPRIDSAVKQILRSNYDVMSAMMIHTVPTSRPPRSSFLWHVDDHPDYRIKIFYYLTDTDRTNGATQSHTWKSSRDLKTRGFLDRRNVSANLEKDLNDPTRYNIVEGKRGTAFIFSENAIHRAIIPERGYRDVVVFELFPSLHRETQYLNIHQRYWDHPFDLMFPRKQAVDRELTYA